MATGPAIGVYWEGKPAVAYLTDDGWECAAAPALAGYLRLAAPLGDTAAGDPAAIAYSAALDALDGFSPLPLSPPIIRRALPGAVN